MVRLLPKIIPVRAPIQLRDDDVLQHCTIQALPDFSGRALITHVGPLSNRIQNVTVRNVNVIGRKDPDDNYYIGDDPKNDNIGTESLYNGIDVRCEGGVFENCTAERIEGTGIVLRRGSSQLQPTNQSYSLTAHHCLSGLHFAQGDSYNDGDQTAYACRDDGIWCESGCTFNGLMSVGDVGGRGMYTNSPSRFLGEILVKGWNARGGLVIDSPGASFKLVRLVDVYFPTIAEYPLSSVPGLIPNEVTSRAGIVWLRNAHISHVEMSLHSGDVGEDLLPRQHPGIIFSSTATGSIVENLQLLEAGQDSIAIRDGSIRGVTVTFSQGFTSEPLPIDPANAAIAVRLVNVNGKGSRYFGNFGNVPIAFSFSGAAASSTTSQRNHVIDILSTSPSPIKVFSGAALHSSVNIRVNNVQVNP